MGVSQNWRYLFGGPYNKDYNIFGSILGSPHFGKLPYRDYIRDYVSQGFVRVILSVLDCSSRAFNSQNVSAKRQHVLRM